MSTVNHWCQDQAEMGNEEEWAEGRTGLSLTWQAPSRKGKFPIKYLILEPEGNQANGINSTLNTRIRCLF